MATPLLITTSQITSWIGEFIWPFARIGMMLMVMPVFGGRLISVRVRVLMALVITLVIMPVLPAMPVVEPLSAEGILIMVHQLLIGLAMGFLLQLVFNALVIGGHAIALSMGLGFATMVDPQNGVNVPVIGQYYITVATLLFLALDGHLALFTVMAESFQYLPVGIVGMSRDAIWDIAAWASYMFAGGILIAVPALAALLLTNIALGVVTRAAPQLNIFGVGFPLTLTFGFVLMFLALPILLPQFQDLLSSAFGLLLDMGNTGGAQ